ncbi:MAG TPA: ABC transporter permease [Thermoanaerobaculia bacterium]|jgi:putative ABC transport system permease protein|nr:ABC transporter permease [Thermoanaerobaculia bacterium]
MKALLQDLRYACRLLLRSPGFTLLAAFTLALGIGANAAIFSVANSVLLKPLPYRDSGRLMIVYSQFPSMSFSRFWVDPMEFTDYSRWNRSFQSLGAYATGPVNVSGRGEPVRADGAAVTAGLFTVLGVNAELGRVFSAAEDLPNTEKVVVLSDGLWRRAFAADPRILNKRIRVDGDDRTVVGVMPPGFTIGNEKIEAWVPLALNPENPGNRGNHYLYMIGRLKPGVTLAQARQEMNGLVDRWKQEAPKKHTPKPVFHPMVVQPLLDDLVGAIRPKIRLLMGAVGLVLLIACVNVANLLLARAEARQKEVAVRTALGAPRGRLIRQFLTESVVLALLGGGLGLLLAYAGVRAIVAANLESIPRADEIGLDGRSILFTLGVSLVTGLLFGLAPALHSRAGSFFAALKEGGQRTTAGAGRQWLRRVLVVVEVAFAAMLVIGGGLLIRSFWLLQKVDPGFDPKGLLSLEVSLPRTSYSDPEQVEGFYQRLVDRVSHLPGVAGVAALSGLPPDRPVNANDLDFESVPKTDDGPDHNVDYWQFVTRDYFKTMKIRLVDGRLFTATDARGTPGVVLINQAMAKVFWPNRNPVGERVRVPGTHATPTSPAKDSPWMTIVGIVADVKQGGLDHKTGTELYFLYDQAQETTGRAPGDMYLAVRTAKDPMSLANPVRSEIRRLDATLPVAAVKPMTQVVYESVGQPRFIAFLVLIFAIVALTLAAIGTYGVLAYTVELRTQEIGVRMALGAQAVQVLRMVLTQGAWMVGSGLLLGVIGALALRRVLESVLFGVAPTDPAIFAAVLAILALVGLFACYLPAQRAMRVDPLVALRRD